MKATFTVVVNVMSLVEVEIAEDGNIDITGLEMINANEGAVVAGEGSPYLNERPELCKQVNLIATVETTKQATALFEQRARASGVQPDRTLAPTMAKASA